MKEEKKYTIEDLPPMPENEREFWKKHNDEYYHYLYRIDNKVNGKYYYGIHSEKKDGVHKLGEDNYMGSGTDLVKAQKEGGMKNFEKTIIKTFSTRDEVRLEEFIVVNEELVKDPMCYNKTVGGGAVNSGVIAVNYRNEKLRKDNFFLVTTEEYHKNKDKYITSSSNKGVFKNKDNNSDVRMLNLNDPLVLSGQFIGITKGVKQSQETILKKTGEKNGNYGKIWITDGKENKKIKKEEKIPDGWHKGRVIENIIIKIKCINKNTNEIKMINKDLIDCINWFPYIFYINGKIIDKDEFLKVVESSESWLDVSRKLNTYIDIVEKFRIYYNIPSKTIISKYGKKIKPRIFHLSLLSTPKKFRTFNLQLRRLSLYPIELWRLYNYKDFKVSILPFE